MCSISFNVRNTLHNGIMSALWWSGDLSGLDPPLLSHPALDRLWWGMNTGRAYHMRHSLLNRSVKMVPRIKIWNVLDVFSDILLRFVSNPLGNVVYLQWTFLFPISSFKIRTFGSIVYVHIFSPDETDLNKQTNNPYVACNRGKGHSKWSKAKKKKFPFIPTSLF